MRLPLVSLLAAALLGACVGVRPKPDSTVPLASEVDLARFMGSWYVIAHIPTEGDASAHNAVETYALNADGSIATTYTNRQGGFAGERKQMTPTAFVVPDTGNALWGMRFQIPGTSIPLPIHFEYRIAHLEPDYSVAIIARSQKDYLWLFSRQAVMSEAELTRYRRIVAGWGYDTSKLVRVPQQWPEEPHK